jgi:ribosomal protein L11 methyltransferase
MPLEAVSVEVPEPALAAYEAALSSVCLAVSFFPNDQTATWRLEGVRASGTDDHALIGALALAASVCGIDVPLRRQPIPADGWLARTHAAFPEQLIGRRFAIRGSHLPSKPSPGRIILQLDAGLAFGSGEHGSTRGCLLALERIAWRRPGRILDLGTGSGILALATARLVRRGVLATDIEPWSVRVARQNAVRNGLGSMVRVRLANGWQHPEVRACGPYNLVLANILARPLCLMARQMTSHLAPGGTAILAGLLRSQAQAVLAAHRRCGLRLEASFQEGPWTTLVLRKPP